MFVYVGQVTDVREQRDGDLVRFEADIDVEDCEMAVIGDGDEQVTVHYWRTADGLDSDGDNGQHSPMRAGTRVRVFITFDTENRAQLLEPNGWEPAE